MSGLDADWKPVTLTIAYSLEYIYLFFSLSMSTSVMAKTGNPFFVGLLALLFGLISIYLQPSRDFLLQKIAEYGIHVPAILVSPPTVVDSAGDIKYIGSSSSSGVEHFQNIFYAEDTSGKRRFAPPVPVKPARGSVIDATQPGAWCPQGTGDVLPFTSRVVNISENCLSLRIARARGTKQDAKLPVVVWMHGGKTPFPVA